MWVSGNGECKEAADNIHTMSVQWDDKAGDFIYKLVNLAEYENGERQVVTKFDGDLNWATRVAEHYGIEVPEVK